MNTDAITINAGQLKIEDLSIEHPDVLQYVRRFETTDRAAAVRRAIEVGATVLDRYESTQNLDFLRQQADLILNEVKASVGKLPGEVQKEVLTKLGTGDGQALAPVATLVGSTEKLLKERLQQVESLLNDHIDPRSSDSTLGAILGSLRLLLDPKHDDSVQKAVEKSLENVTDEDGLLSVAVQKVVEKAVKPMREKLDDLAKEVRSQEAVATALQNTPAKGRTFEDDLLPVASAWAKMVGGDIEHVGPDNQPGDIVITIGPSGMSTAELRIVIEARDDATARGRKRVLDGMSKAMETRNADYGIYVAKSTDALAQEIGEWAELRGEAGPVIACTAPHLTTALRFTAAETTVRLLNSSSAQTDAAAIEAELGRMRSVLARIRTINTKSSAIRTATEGIANEADNLRRELTTSIAAIETAIARVGDVARSPDAA